MCKENTSQLRIPAQLGMERAPLLSSSPALTAQLFKKAILASVLWLCYEVMVPDWYFSLSLGADFTASANKQNSNVI